MAERASKVPVEKFSSERSERRKVFEPKAKRSAAGGLARAGHPATIGGQKKAIRPVRVQRAAGVSTCTEDEQIVVVV